MSARGAGPSDGPIGVVGLGNMGAPMSGRLVGAGWQVIGYDAAGTAARLPSGASAAGSVAEIAQAAPVVLLSLPDGDASSAVARDIAGAEARRAAVVVDTSTIGIDAARSAARRSTRRASPMSMRRSPAALPAPAPAPWR